MPLIDNVAAGLALACLLWFFRRLARWWNGRTDRTDRPKETHPMSPDPYIPYQIRRLQEEVHTLSERAGLSTDKLLDKLKGHGIGRSKLFDIKKRPHEAKRADVVALCRVLAQAIDAGREVRRANEDDVVMLVDSLWERAQPDSIRKGKDTEAVVRTLWRSFGDGTITMPEVTPEAVAAINASQPTHVDIAGREAHVHLQVPDDDAVDFFMSDPRGRMLERALDRYTMKWLRATVDVVLVAWHTPEPV
ncbi:hypothetical protein [Kitasatospora sp. NPDC088134]|uniref:hypothetical protein n=1 Tax=Kitasatospora sp. NPDC088134 TaxID=3364071 RepID=UPI0038054FC5